MNARTLALALSLLLSVLSAPRASAAPQPEGRRQLQEALQQHYTHLLIERLELDEAAARRLRPRIEALVEAQSRSMAAGRRSLHALRQELAASSTERLGELLDAVLRAEGEGLDGTTRARRAFLSELDARRQATFLLFEDEYREEVARRLRGMKGGRSPWPHAEDTEARASTPERKEELIENLTLLLTLLAGRQLELDTAECVALTPDLEALVTAQVELAELERVGRARLGAALESGDEARLRQWVSELEEGRERWRRRLLDARRALAGRLEPEAAARLFVLQERFRREGPRRLRLLDRLLSDSPEERGGREAPSRGGMRWRERSR